jgi:uncharacterized protein with PIN domain
VDTPSEPRFFCDVMLGGLARWLRAAGYDAAWQKHIADPELVRLARREGRVLLSSDTGIFKIGIVRDGDVPALMVPHGLTVQEQLAHVLKGLGLPLRAARCMACGGSLREVSKEQVGERVPPRTYARVDRYWECERCGQLFWHGTHWERIAAQLRGLDIPSADAAPEPPAPTGPSA